MRKGRRPETKPNAGGDASDNDHPIAGVGVAGSSPSSAPGKLPLTSANAYFVSASGAFFHPRHQRNTNEIRRSLLAVASGNLVQLVPIARPKIIDDLEELLVEALPSCPAVHLPAGDWWMSR